MSDAHLVDPEPVVADHLGKIGAEQLAQRIRAYWSGMGPLRVKEFIVSDRKVGAGLEINPAE
jgi:hypothetical protein